MREDGSGTRAVFAEFIAGMSVRRPQLSVEAGSNETIRQAVMPGLGIALISGHTVAAELVDGRLVLLDLQNVPIRRQWFAVRRLGKAQGPAAAEFWRFMIERGASFLPAIR